MLTKQPFGPSVLAQDHKAEDAASHRRNQFVIRDP
jgi:hypothetical protein